MKQNTGALAKALYSNTPETPNELLFRKGDILTVIEFDYDGQKDWWLCSHRGQRGICPSNYLELLEDKYALPILPIYANGYSTVQRTLSNSGSREISESAPSLQNEGEGNKSEKQQEEFDPLETYDVPRSCVQNLSNLSNQIEVEDSQISPFYSNQPLYENEESHSQSPITKTSPLDLYDVPRSQLPIYGQSLARLRKYGAESETSLASSGRFPFNRNNNPSDNSNEPFARSSSSCDLGLPPSGSKRSPINSNLPSTSINAIPGNVTQNSTNPWNSDRSISQTSGSSQNQLCQPSQPKLNNSNIISLNHKSNRLSVQSESADSGIVMVLSSPMQDLYDVPRSTQPIPVISGSNDASENDSFSRAQSSLSISSSGMGLSIANSDSKDSLDTYDVPRSVKSYVNHMETKYDQLAQSKQGSTTSLARDGQSSISDHSRHNSASSIFSAYGYTKKGSGSSRDAPSSEYTNGVRVQLGNNSDSRSSLTSVSSSNAAQLHPGNELYDFPRSSAPPPPPHRRLRPGISGSSMSITSQASLISGGTSQSQESFGMLYDFPSSSTRKVSLCESTETLSCQDTFDDTHELRLGASSSSISSSLSRNLRSASQCNNSSGNINGATAGGSANGSSEVKILPLGPKSAVSVSEKLRHEVVTSITSILDHVKPKWRSKENLTEIMPDLRFGCIRLGLAIKDLADFASRSMSNVKKLKDEALLSKLHRLLTPVVNASQIIQRDVDELEAYFWSVDRLSISHGSHQEKNISGDALDQLILCARSLKHDVTEISNFLALNSSAIFRENDPPKSKPSAPKVETKVEDTREDYDYVCLISASQREGATADSKKSSINNQPSSDLEQQIDARDQQLLEFYSAQIATSAPILSQSISTFISSIQQNEPPESFNVHLKYVILMAYKMLFAGDTIHRNLNNAQLKGEIEKKANDLHKSIIALYEASKVATTEFPRIAPMQTIVERVWCTTQAATQLKKVIFNATCSSL